MSKKTSQDQSFEVLYIQTKNELKKMEAIIDVFTKDYNIGENRKQVLDDELVDVLPRPDFDYDSGYGGEYESIIVDHISQDSLLHLRDMIKNQLKNLNRKG